MGKPHMSPYRNPPLTLFGAVFLVGLSSLHASDAIIHTVAGTGQPDNNSQAGKATEVNIGAPFGVETGPGGGLYITEVGNHRVRRVRP